MNTFLDKIYLISPSFFQNLMVTVFDVIMYKKRKGGNYLKWKKYHKGFWTKNSEELKLEQERRLKDFLIYVSKNSEYYKDKLKNINFDNFSLDELKKIPILEKEILRKDFEMIKTISKDNSYISHTGGTSGKSLTVFFTWDNINERQAILDLFREQYGYRLGNKMAWFSGKSLINKKDLNKNVFWKTDYFYNIRYYSTYHTSDEFLEFYIKDIKTYKPLFMSGFPSTVYEIANYGLKRNIKLNFNVNCFFPTAETLVQEQIDVIRLFFGCKVADQYASSEGAPFIINDIRDGRMHHYLLSGVIEVVEEKNSKGYEKGEMLLTSFTTKGTPLIRYRIGDKIKFSASKTYPKLGNPIVESIYGRINDYIYSVEFGKINLGNISNCVKYVNGVTRFQIIQDCLEEIVVNIVKESSFTLMDEEIFKKELRLRLGDKIKIVFNYLDHIAKEKSGKFSIVKNNIHHLLE